MRKLLIWTAVILLLLVTNFLTYSFARQDAPPAVTEEDTAGEANYQEEYRLLFEVMEILEEDYVDPVEAEELLEGAVEGMVDSLEDPQSSYLDQEALEELLLETEGTFGGIGVRVTEVEGRVTVVEVLPDTPSEEVGLQRGDHIWKVDGQEMEEDPLEEAVDMMRGEEGTEVQLNVKRPGASEPLEFDITRQQIRAPTVYHQWIDQEAGLGYIEISSFDRETSGDFLEALQQMEEEGLEGLVLDLRYNPGGLLDQAINVAEELVPEGEITSLVGRDDQVIDTYHSQTGAKPYPISVLINQDTASGSEIIGGALQDHQAAELVGTSTFGKATVQNIERDLSEGGLRYTVARYVTPEGRDLHEDGLNPDHEVDPSRVFSYYRYFIPEELEEGDRGEAVQMLQEMLNAVDMEVELSGVYDEQTKEALRNFQEEVGLEADGEFGEVTWLELREKIDERVMEEDPQIEKAVEVIRGGSN